jgi:diguanylate cyclase (GGDEF)-like protein
MIALGVLSVTLSPLTALIAPIRNALLLTGFLTLFGVTIARGLAGFRPAWWLPPALLMLFFQPGYVLVRHAFGVNAPFLDRWAFEVGTLGDTFLFGLAILAHGRYVVLERRAIQRRLDEVTHDARHDALTGVLNRRGLFSSIGASGGRGTLFFVDLDNFKMINDRYGHATGDAVLKQVAKAIRETVAEDDVVARIGGDEFVVVTREVERGPADRLAWRLASRIATLGPEDAEPHNRFGASIGYVDFDGIHFENALRRADSEAYHIKAEKRQRVLG